MSNRRPAPAEVGDIITRGFWAWHDPGDESAPPLAGRRWLTVTGEGDAASPRRFQVTVAGTTGSFALAPEPVEAEVAAELLDDLAAQAQQAAETFRYLERLADLDVPTARIETLREIGQGSAARGLRVVMEWYLAQNHGP